MLLLRMSLSGANVLILDEPTRNFSPLSGPVIRKMLREFPGAVISISHDRKYIEEVCDKIYQLNPNGLQLMVIDNKKDERLTNFRLLVSWKAYKDLNLEDRLWYVQKMHVKL